MMCDILDISAGRNKTKVSTEYNLFIEYSFSIVKVNDIENYVLSTIFVDCI